MQINQKKIALICEDPKPRGVTYSTMVYASILSQHPGYWVHILFQSVPASETLESFKKKYPRINFKNFSDENLDTFSYIYLQHDDPKLGKKYFNKISSHAVFLNLQSVLYAKYFVSHWLSRVSSFGLIPGVPLIVDFSHPATDIRMRNSLNIPTSAIVIGCHGGANQFDIDFVKIAIGTSLSMRNDIYYIFVGVNKFISHERVSFIDPTFDRNIVESFILSCDIMLHGRYMGETFGLAIHEFLYFGKPVLTWIGGWDRNHLHTGSKLITPYWTYNDLILKLMSLEKIIAPLDASSIKFSDQDRESIISALLYDNQLCLIARYLIFPFSVLNIMMHKVIFKILNIALTIISKYQISKARK